MFKPYTSFGGEQLELLDGVVAGVAVSKGGAVDGEPGAAGGIVRVEGVAVSKGGAVDGEPGAAGGIVRVESPPVW